MKMKERSVGAAEFGMVIHAGLSATVLVTWLARGMVVSAVASKSPSKVSLLPLLTLLFTEISIKWPERIVAKVVAE